MLPPTCVVVPTYWTRAGGASLPGDAVYDHPTPLDDEGTLDALLKSLAALEPGKFYLMLLVAVTADDSAQAAEAKVRSLADRYPTIGSIVFGPSGLPWLLGELSNAGISNPAGSLALREYARIRNLQLALPLALRSTHIVAVDDDEIVTDRHFLDKAVEALGSSVDGVVVQGLSGHYEQEDGSIMLKTDAEKATSPNLFDRKAAIMNAATEMLERLPGNLVPTPFCFGGNMEFTAEMAATVGFDPGITRGEDIDYLINARLEGKQFFLRKDMTILHCPPSGGSYADVKISKLEQDVYRFVYEREKLRASHEVPALRPLNAPELDPYPGEFLRGDIETQAIEALRAAGYSGDAEALVRDAQSTAGAKVQRYLRFREDWPRLQEAVSSSDTIFERLASGFTHAV